MTAGGSLAPLLGPIFGVGASRGVGVLITIVGLLTAAVSVVAVFTPRIRRVELDLPDYEIPEKLEA
jgi:hypothetical protein